MENNQNELDEKIELLVDEDVIEEADEYLSEDDVEEIQEGRVMYWIKELLSGSLDQIVAVALGLALFLLTRLVLGLFGFRIAMKQEMFLILFILSNILYYPVVKEILKGKTLGEKVIKR